jgi:hypothetical protein
MDQAKDDFGRSLKWGLGALGAFVIVLASSAWLIGPGHDMPPARQTASRPAGNSTFGLWFSDAHRILVENQAADDERRAVLFKGAISAMGERCDAVINALMQERGKWDVLCAPGYHYRLEFDQDDASFKKAERVR